MSEPFVTVLRDIEREPHTFAPYVMASWAGKAAKELERLSSEGKKKDECLEACRVKLEKLFDATEGVYHGGMEHSQLMKLISSVSGRQ